MSRLRRKAVPFVIIMTVIAGLWLAVVRFGIEVHVVETGSMDPTLPINSRVITTKVDDVQVGDIIMFRNHESGGLTTHTFIGYADDGSLMTKGDANLTPDVHTPPLQPSDVVGKVWFHVDVFTVAFWTSLRGVALVVALIAMVVVTETGTKPKEGVSPRTNTSAPTPV